MDVADDCSWRDVGARRRILWRNVPSAVVGVGRIMAGANCRAGGFGRAGSFGLACRWLAVGGLLDVGVAGLDRRHIGHGLREHGSSQFASTAFYLCHGRMFGVGAPANEGWRRLCGLGLCAADLVGRIGSVAGVGAGGRTGLL